MIRTILFALASCFALMGCAKIANLGIDPARLDTANKRLIAYAGEIEALAMFGEELVARGVLPPEHGAHAAQYLQDALDLVEEAQAQIAQTGDPVAAETKLERVRRSIDLALGMLTMLAPRDTASFLSNRKAPLYENAHRRLCPI